MKAFKMRRLGFLQAPYFIAIVFFTSFLYLIFEYFFIPNTVLAADEFVFARHIFDYTIALPYRDFPPYKTVLGYYLFSIPFFFAHGILAPLIYIKNEIALINALCIALSGIWASRVFKTYIPVLLALFAVIANQSFLNYSVDLRVDMLCSWFCLFSILALLDKKPILAGLLLGISFLISQKALWYIAAIDTAFVVFLLTNPTMFSRKEVIAFNTSMIFPILFYILFWSILSNPIIVLQNLFYEAYIQVGIEWYSNIYLTCWLIVLTHGPLLFFMWPVTFISILNKHPDDKGYDQRIFNLVVASIALLLFVHYKQAFPYNFVFTIPAYFLLYATFIQWFLMQSQTLYPLKFSSFAVTIITFYSFTISCFLLYFPYFHWSYSCIGVIPLLTIYALSAKENQKKILINLMLILFTLTGIGIPFYTQIKTSKLLDGHYQQTILKLADQLMKPNETYIAGIPYFYSKEQPIAGMKNLIGPELSYINAPQRAIEPLLLSSIYLAKTTQQEIIDEWERAPIKLVLTNYRIVYLTKSIRDYIQNHYQHFYGSIYLYAPVISAKQFNCYLKFSGNYKIAETKQPIKLDGKLYKPNSIHFIKAGDHLSSAKRNYRLVLIPDISKKELSNLYLEDNWISMIKAILT